MRSVLAVFFGFIAVALCWALYAPAVSTLAVRELQEPGADIARLERRLRESGAGATQALREALESPDWSVRLRAARLLALQGERDGDRFLLDSLHDAGRRGDGPQGGMAEALILSVWEERGAPSSAVRQKIARLDGGELSGHGPDDAELMPLLDEALKKNPDWSGGYLRRARLYFRNGESLRAKEDAVRVLLLEPDHFEAMTVLGLCYLTIRAPQQAYLCVERAVRVNPRVSKSMQAGIGDILRALERDRRRKRDEMRREKPLV